MGKEAYGTRDLWNQFKDNPLDMFKSKVSEMQEAGIEEMPTLSRVLEEYSPTDPTDGPDALDAFERLMMEIGLRTNSSPDWDGYRASYGKKFFDSPGGRVLFTEFCARQWRAVSHPKQRELAQKRAMLLNSDGIIGGWERPYYDSLDVRPSQQIQPTIPLSELVGFTTSIDTDSYRMFYLTYDATQLRKYRVGETAAIPVATIVGAERAVRLKKYGRGIAASYEVMRRMRVDKIARYIQMMAVQTEIDKVAAGLDILINGDGNSGTSATVHNLTTMDSGASAGTLTLKGWENFKLQFVQPYMLTTALMQSPVALQLRLLNTGTTNIPLAATNFGTNLTLINQLSDGVRYGYTSDSPALKIVGFDKRQALEMINEVGADITEMERAAQNQIQTLYLSEVMGFAIMDANSVRVLDVNA